MKRKNKGKMKNKLQKKIIKSLGDNPKYLKEYHKNETIKDKEKFLHSLYDNKKVKLDIAFFEIILDLSGEYFKSNNYNEIIKIILELRNKRLDFFKFYEEPYYKLLIASAIYLKDDVKIENYFSEAKTIIDNDPDEFYTLFSFLNIMGKYDISFKLR